MSDDYEPTGIDLVLASVEKIVAAHNGVLAGGFGPTSHEWHVMHHDLWASYGAFILAEQEADEHG